MPISVFEGDPAVRGLRAFLAAVAQAVNARDLRLPALVAASTARRAEANERIYASGFGRHYPAPNPVAVLSVRAVTGTRRDVLACSVEEGFTLDRPGGVPAGPRVVLAGTFSMVLEDGRWELDQARAAEGRTCDGVPLQGEGA